MGRAELAAIAAAITNNHIHIAIDSLTSHHQIRHKFNHQPGFNQEMFETTMKQLVG